MANECLVTKLKGVVNNPSLPKLGVVRFPADYADTTAKMYINYPRGFDTTGLYCNFLDVNFNVVGSKAIASTYYYEQFSFANSELPANTKYIEINQKYSVVGITLDMGGGSRFLTKLDMKEFLYNEFFNDLGCRHDKQAFVDGTTLLDLNKTIQNLDIENANISGDVAVLGSFPRITLMKLYACTGVYGDFEDFAKPQFEYGTEKTIAMSFGHGCGVKFKGELLLADVGYSLEIYSDHMDLKMNGDTISSSTDGITWS